MRLNYIDNIDCQQRIADTLDEMLEEGASV